MSTLFELLIVWGVLTAALIALLIYRGTLTMQEDDQLFLGESESHMAREQMEIMNRVHKLGPFTRIGLFAGGDRFTERSAIPGMTTAACLVSRS
jgi:hypothetical protein